MNKSTFRNLAIVLFALVAILVGVELSDRGASVSSGDLLFPEFKARINDVDRLVVEAPGEEAVTISNASGTWGVVNRADYPASVAKIREVLLALADAQILEEKTSDPARYAALGVTAPEMADSRGTRLTVAGGDVEIGLIVGDMNQGSNRYVLPDDRATSLLIDKDPALPESIGDWLRKDLLDIDATQISVASIRHADDETIEVFKASRDSSNFEVQDLPDGRELSYPTVANGIGSALSDLELEDVRRAEPLDAEAVNNFETFDGLRITVRVFGEGDERWVAISAAANEPADGEQGADAAGEAGEDAPASDSDPVAGAASLNARLEGWQFRVATYKLDQLTRRWVDLLKAETD